MATNPSRSVGGSTPDDTKTAAKAEVSDLKHKVQDEAKDRLDEGKASAAGALEDVASALHDAGDALRERDRDAFARYADAAADQVEQLTRSIRDRNVGEILDEAQRFARRDPGLFIGGAFLLGIFGARFLKASAPSSNRSGYGSGYGRQGYRGGYADYAGGARSGEYAAEPPFRVRNTAGGEMPNPDAAWTQAPASAASETRTSETRSSAT